MENFVTLIVVIVFFAIVFRKRLVPFIKNRKDRSGKPAVVNALPDQTVPEHLCVLAFDVNRYGANIVEFGEDVSVHLEKKLDYLRMDGMVSGVDLVPFGRILLVVIRWQTSAGGKEVKHG